MNSCKYWRHLAILTAVSTLLAACASGASSMDSGGPNGSAASGANSGPTSGGNNGSNANGNNNNSNPPESGATDPAYQLARGDEIYVSVYNENDLSLDQKIDSRGIIRLPYLGEVTVSGLSVRQAESNLEKLLVEKKLLRKPMVTITVRDYASHEVLVNGAVNSPGRYRMPREKADVEIVDVITSMGGFRAGAKSDQVKVTRTSDSGEEKTMTVDVEAMINPRKGDQTQKSFLIYPGDRIFVPISIW